MEQQSELFAELEDSGREWKPKHFLDFAGLPSKVYPTSVKVLQQGPDVLIYREADAATGITMAQHRLFTNLVRNANHPDSEGTHTVLVVTGLPAVTGNPRGTVRSMCVYDHMTLGDEPKFRPCHTTDIQSYIQQWFNERQGRR